MRNLKMKKILQQAYCPRGTPETENVGRQGQREAVSGHGIRLMRYGKGSRISLILPLVKG